jgi:hypothetical protein
MFEIINCAYSHKNPSNTDNNIPFPTAVGKWYTTQISYEQRFQPRISTTSSYTAVIVCGCDRCTPAATEYLVLTGTDTVDTTDPQ